MVGGLGFVGGPRAGADAGADTGARAGAEVGSRAIVVGAAGVEAADVANAAIVVVMVGGGEDSDDAMPGEAPAGRPATPPGPKSAINASYELGFELAPSDDDPESK